MPQHICDHGEDDRETEVQAGEGEHVSCVVLFWPFRLLIGTAVVSRASACCDLPLIPPWLQLD